RSDAGESEQALADEHLLSYRKWIGLPLAIQSRWSSLLLRRERQRSDAELSRRRRIHAPFEYQLRGRPSGLYLRAASEEKSEKFLLLRKHKAEPEIFFQHECQLRLECFRLRFRRVTKIYPRESRSACRFECRA